MGTYSHIDNVKVKRPIFSKCRKFRYRLEIERSYISSGKTVCVIMQNPSVANCRKADKSVQFIEKLIFEKGYAEFKCVNRIIVVNQFAYIQTKNFNGKDKHIGSKNNFYIEKSIKESDIILIAWGKIGNRYAARQEFINDLLKATYNKKLLKTKVHPSVGSYPDFVEVYNLPK